MKALITGGKGFVGKHLHDHLVELGFTVATFDLRDEQDIRNYEQIRQAIDLFRPDYLFHLAALTYVPESYEDPKRTFDINIQGTLNVLEAVRKSGLKTKIHIASTSEDAGTFSPYGISKTASQLLAESYISRYDMPIVVSRTYSHTGPGKGEEMAESAFAKQIAQIEAGRRDKLVHSNLEARRSFCDVRDVVRAYITLIDEPAGIYELNPHRDNTMQEILDILISQSKVKVKTEYTDKYGRGKVPIVQISNFQEYDWTPEFELEDTLKDLLDYWRNNI